jgi:hypothetical protein
MAGGPPWHQSQQHADDLHRRHQPALTLVIQTRSLLPEQLLDGLDEAVTTSLM